jgi:hypothetical protein
MVYVTDLAAGELEAGELGNSKTDGTDPGSDEKDEKASIQGGSR